jgi:hypothetical protein
MDVYDRPPSSPKQQSKTFSPASTRLRPNQNAFRDRRHLCRAIICADIDRRLLKLAKHSQAVGTHSQSLQFHSILTGVHLLHRLANLIQRHLIDVRLASLARRITVIHTNLRQFPCRSDVTIILSCFRKLVRKLRVIHP